MLDILSSLDVNSFMGLNSKSENLCTLELTVVTGLEEVAAQEIREKLSVDPVSCRGRILIDIATSKVKEVLKMRSIDHAFIVVHMKPNFLLTDEREKCFSELYQYSTQPDWKKGLKVWQSIFDIDVGNPFDREGPLQDRFCEPRPELDLILIKKESPVALNLPENVQVSIANQKSEREKTDNKVIPEKEKTDNEVIPEKEKTDNEVIPEKEKTDNKVIPEKSKFGPKFRVSCHRVGSAHKFGSPEAARQFGAGINEMFSWPVDLKNFDLEIHLNILDDFTYVSIGLTKEPLFKRNISVFGPTNLRATICYNMINLAKPESGDIIIDPMCGGSTIPMEGALTDSKSFYMGGDNHKIALSRSRANIDNLETPLNIDVVQWDCTRLPLRSQSADVIVSDFPFGKRLGSKGDNRVLYYKSLVELARITRVRTGRAVLLTHDRNSMTKNLGTVSKLWKHFSCRTVNIGGLSAALYLLHRTSLMSDPNIISISANSKNDKKRKWNSDS